MQGSLRINLLGKHMMLNVTNVNGVATNAEVKTMSEVEVSLHRLVRKTDCTAEEKEEAASLQVYQPYPDWEARPRYYRKNPLLSSRGCDTLLFEASLLASGEKEIIGYDEALVKPTFSDFTQRFSKRNTTKSVLLEDIVRMFYATATSEQSKDATSSDAMWKADVERSAALLMKVLIEIIEDQHNFDKDVVAQLRSEQAQMITRANEAVKLASGSYFRQSFTDRQSTFDDAEGNQLEIDFPTLKALKLRMHISVDARVQFELHGSAPRIRSRFTTILMEERARLSFSAARSQALSDHRDLQTETDAVEVRPRGPTNSTLVSQLLHQADAPGASSEELESNHRDAMQTKEAVMERPPGMLRCYSCQNTWVSTLAADLRDCPKCGSYSVFAESSRRTASPDQEHVPHRASAPGEEALGQYFSERTDKYMNLYRREQPLPRSTADSHESLSNPWEHLNSSSNTSLAKASRAPQEEPLAQTGQLTTEPALETRSEMTAAQWDGMQKVLQHICDYRNEECVQKHLRP